MNQLSNIVIDFARYRRANAAARGRTAPDQGGPLACRWRRDAATGRLFCGWATQKGAREAQPPSRRSLAA
jgi:hypothetical protein